MSKEQIATFNAASKAWFQALRACDNFAPYRPLFEHLDHSRLVPIPWNAA